jgi:hypothetical protein
MNVARQHRRGVAPDAMNRTRAARRLPPLRRSPPLARPAQAHSSRLSGLGYLAHQGAGGAPFYTRLVAAGVSPLQPMGENLAMVPGCDPEGVREAVRLWLASAPPSREPARTPVQPHRHRRGQLAGLHRHLLHGRLRRPRRRG